jgi:hypothetical protein
MRQQFHQLVKEFCTLASLEHHDAIDEGRSFCVDGVECALIYLDHLMPDTIYCYVDFGEPPAERCADVYQELLKANYIHLAGGRAGFTVSPESGHVILVSALCLAGAKPEALADLLSYHAQQALEWRRTHYLDQPAPAGGDTPANAGMHFA